jgi:hypothetical protein
MPLFSRIPIQTFPVYGTVYIHYLVLDPRIRDPSRPQCLLWET